MKDKDKIKKVNIGKEEEISTIFSKAIDMKKVKYKLGDKIKLNHEGLLRII